MVDYIGSNVTAALLFNGLVMGFTLHSTRKGRNLLSREYIYCWFDVLREHDLPGDIDQYDHWPNSRVHYPRQS